MSKTNRDIEELEKSLKTLGKYIELSKAGQLELSLDIPTQIYKIFFDSNRHNKKSTLFERVCGNKLVKFHPFIRQINNSGNKYQMTSPAGTIRLTKDGIEVELIDFDAKPIELEHWQQQIVQVTSGIEISVKDYIEYLRNQESAHLDPKPHDKLEAIKAINFLEKGVHSKHEKVLIVIAEYLVNRTYEELLEDLDEIMRWGKELFSAEKYSSALERFNKILDRDINNTEALFLKGGCFYGLEQYEDAIEVMNTILDVEKHNIRALEVKGLSLIQLQRYVVSAKCFEQVTKLQQNHITSYYYWAQSLICMGEIDPAISRLEQAIDLPEAKYLLAVLLIDRGMIIRAIAYLNEVLSTMADFADGWFILGKAHELDGNIDKAIECLTQARLLNSSLSVQIPQLHLFDKIMLLDMLSGNKTEGYRPSVAVKYDDIGFGTEVGSNNYKTPIIIRMSASNMTLDMIHNDADFFVITSNIYDPDLDISKLRCQKLYAWLIENKVSENVVNLIMSEIDGKRNGELFLILKRVLMG